ncbi:MAG: transcriptional regulator [Dehalococcoidia bacterium]
MAKKFRDLVKHINEDPNRRAQVDEEKRAIEDSLALGALREHRGATQTGIAGSLGTSQANVWRIEHERDIYLSTLGRYVAALGGHLEINAVFPDETIHLLPPVTADSITARR